MPALLLVRHGQASFGAEDYDVLSPLGHEQARVVARELARRRLDVARVVAGGLKRQRDTIAPFAEVAGLEVQTDARWDEYDSDGLLAAHSTVAARLEREPGDDGPPLSSRAFQDVLDGALLDWIAAGATGPAREPWPAFAARVEGALRAAAEGLGRGETAVVCTSAGVLAAVAVALLGGEAATFVAFNRVGVNASITRIAVGRGGLNLVSFNEHGHLEPSPPGGQALITYR